MTIYDKAWHDRVIAKHLANKANETLPDENAGQHNAIDPSCERVDGILTLNPEEW